MVQILTVCRIGTGWGVRDVTGAEYGHSTDVRDAVETARRMARRIGSQVVLSAEADEEILTPSAGAPVDRFGASSQKSAHRVRAFLTRLTRWRGGK